MSFAFMKCFACPQVAILPSVCFTILVVSSTRSRYETVSAGAPPFVQPHRSSNWIGTGVRELDLGTAEKKESGQASRAKRVGPRESGQASRAMACTRVWLAIRYRRRRGQARRRQAKRAGAQCRGGCAAAGAAGRRQLDCMVCACDVFSALFIGVPGIEVPLKA